MFADTQVLVYVCMVLSFVTTRADKTPVVSVGIVVFESEKDDEEEGDFYHRLVPSKNVVECL